MRPVEADLKPFDKGYFKIHNLKFQTLIVGRIDRLALRDDPKYGPVVDLFYGWRASTHRAEDWPNHFEEPRHGASPDIILLDHHTFAWGENGRLAYFGMKNDDVGIFARPFDPLFDEAMIPERYRSY